MGAASEDEIREHPHHQPPLEHDTEPAPPSELQLMLRLSDQLDDFEQRSNDMLMLAARLDRIERALELHLRNHHDGQGCQMALLELNRALPTTTTDKET